MPFAGMHFMGLQTLPRVCMHWAMCMLCFFLHACTPICLHAHPFAWIKSCPYTCTPMTLHACICLHPNSCACICSCMHLHCTILCMYLFVHSRSCMFAFTCLRAFVHMCVCACTVGASMCMYVHFCEYMHLGSHMCKHLLCVHFLFVVCSWLQVHLHMRSAVCMHMHL